MPQYTIETMFPEYLSVHLVVERGRLLAYFVDDSEGEGRVYLGAPETAILLRAFELGHARLSQQQIDGVNAVERVDYERWVAGGAGFQSGVATAESEDFARDRVEQERAWAAPDARWYVYLLKGDSYHKIGVTTNVQRRLRELRTHAGAKVLEVAAVAAVADARGREAELHRRYRACRVRGEWFDLASEQAEEIVALLSEWDVGGGEPSIEPATDDEEPRGDGSPDEVVSLLQRGDAQPEGARPAAGDVQALGEPAVPGE